ncbi:MAG: N-acetylglucosamine-6-sulfatase [Thermoleophilaceae bacterium]|nr:N-acetylglucosamine-6-sulfatase [Thermoleophilaceae bacterium]MEA2349605.1 N-acetylglucosamine-6-sulfatase [Thermoleophilaceae bacterium]
MFLNSARRSARRRLILALTVAAVVSASVGGCGGCGGPGAGPRKHVERRPQPPVTNLNAPPPVDRRHPNIVFVLTDDLASNLVRFAPHVRRMQARGVTFKRYFVTDSLCCPSRASIFSGRFPHNTHIFTNTPPDGGFHSFRRRGEELSTFATALGGAGYRTALMGKYLNGYLPVARSGRSHVPPGWSQWDVAGNGYPEFNYLLNENGGVVPYGRRPAAYLTDVLARKGADFIRRSAAARQPFALELATFAPHAPYTPAPRDAHRFPRARVPRTPAFNRENSKAPRWLAAGRPLPRSWLRLMDRSFRKRAQSVLAIDRMVAGVESALKAAGVADNTYVIFSSDNGLHMGEHRLLPGKLTAFDSDIRVPLIVTGPGIAHGRTVHKMVENVDLAPTLSQLAGTRMLSSVDGHSIVPLLHGQAVARWRDAVLIEHHGPVRGPFDPDLPDVGSGNPPSYEAVRTPHEVYVEYATGEAEYYDLARDPFEMHNAVARLSRRRRARLHATLNALESCRGRRACWAAGHIARRRG